MHRSGIALRETVVIAALGMVLLMLLLMWLGRTQGSSRRILCEQRQQQTSAAIMQYEAVYDQYPGYKNLQAIDAKDEAKPTGWIFGLLPYLGYGLYEPLETQPGELKKLATDPDIQRPYAPLFKDYGPTGTDTQRGRTPRQRIVELICPDDPTRSSAGEGDDGSGASTNSMSFVVNTGMHDAESFGEFPADWNANGIFQNLFDEGAAEQPHVSVRWLSEHDGLENTLMISENVDAGAWTNTVEPLLGFTWAARVVDSRPAPAKLLRINQQRGAGDGSPKFARPSSFHAGGVNVVYASGKTQFLSEDIDWLVYARLMSSDGANAKLPGTETAVPAVYR